MAGPFSRQVSRPPPRLLIALYDQIAGVLAVADAVIGSGRRWRLRRLRTSWMRKSRSSVGFAALIAATPVVMMACGKAPPPSASPQPPPTAKTTTGEARSTSLPNARPLREGDKPISEVHDLMPGGECPDPGPAASAVMTAAGSARIPLKVGLTLSSTWKANSEDYEHECLKQVTKMDARGFTATLSCPIGRDHKPLTTTRHLCWTDFNDSYLYIPQALP